MQDLTAGDLLRALRVLGIDVAASDGQLAIRAPSGSLTPEWRERIVAAKPDLLALVRGAGDEASAPVGFVQRRMWAIDQLDADTRFNNLPGSWRLHGPMDRDAFRRALDAIVERHAILRTAFDERGPEPRQVVEPGARVDLPFVDATMLSADELMERMRGELDVRFDLTRAPLLRAWVYHTGPDEHVLYVVAHHAIWDGWCWDVFHAELAHFYDAFRTRTGRALEPLPFQFADYAAWHRLEMTGEVAERQLAFWTGVLAGIPEHLDLPHDRMPVRATNLADQEGERRMLHLPVATMEPLRRLARAEGATTFMALLAAYAAWLHRYSGQTDFGIGVPIQDRLRPGSEQLLGPMVNTIVIRLRPRPDLTFRAFVAQVRDACLDAFEHQDLPYDRLVDALADRRRVFDAMPFFKALFSYQDVSTRPADIGNLRVSQVHVPTNISIADVAVGCMARDGEVTGLLDFGADLFTPETVDRLVDGLVRLARSAGASPDTRLADLELASPDELHRLHEAWNATDRPLPEGTVLDGIARRVWDAGDRPAVGQGSVVLTQADLWVRAGAVATALRARGVRPGALVGLSCARTPDLVSGLLGIWRAGAAYVPLDPDFPADRLRFIVQDAGLDVVLVDGRAGVWDTEVTAVDLSEAVAGSARLDAPPPAQDDLAYVIYTSGSTGRPKGVEVTHRNLTNFLASMADAPGMDATDVLLAVTTPSFDIAGLELWLPLWVGARIEMATNDEVRDGHRLARRLEGSGATMMQATPATWRMLLDAGWHGRVARVLCGGEAFPGDLVEPLRARADEVWNMYGPTETTIWSTIARVGPRDDGRGSVPIGRPIGNTRVYVMDPAGRMVPQGATGELWIAGAGVARGYRDRAELTAERFVPDPVHPGARAYRTGDLARWRNDGALEHLGRGDDQVKVQGFRIELGEVETVLLAMPEVREAVAAVHRDPGGNSRLVAYVVYRDGAHATASEVRRFLRATLPAYMIPGMVAEVPDIPRTPNGKVDRRALPDPLRSAAPTGFVEPATPAERLVAEAWGELLPVDRVGRHDNFFELGGHSLLSIRAVASLEDRTGVRLDPRMFFFQTVEQIASALSAVPKAEVS